MISVVYLSDASHPFTDDDLAVLLLVSRANNTRDGLSGMLLYREGRFMQVLEGPVDAVNARLTVIEKDPRHRNVQVLATEEIPAPRFGEWSMGYQPTTDQLADELPGFNEFFVRTDALTVQDRASKVAALLTWFRNHPLAAPQHA